MEFYKVLREVFCSYAEAQPQSFLSIVADFAPDQIRERKLLRIAAESGYVAVLLRMEDSQTSDQDGSFRKICADLAEKSGMDPGYVETICREMMRVFGDGSQPDHPAAAGSDPCKTASASIKGQKTDAFHPCVKGSILQFGRYCQKTGSDLPEPIEWLVLDIQDGRALLISRYGLAAKPYNANYVIATWETCTLRKWLNRDFLNTAFTAQEQDRIIRAEADNMPSQGNPGWPVSGGNNTEDRIHLLSYMEAAKYFSSDSGRQCRPTAYANAQGALTDEDNGCCWWWLRSPGFLQRSTAVVSSDGSIGGSSTCDIKTGVVRPAFWLKLDSWIRCSRRSR